MATEEKPDSRDSLSRSGKDKKGEFHSGITREFLVLFVFNIACSAGIIIMGRNINQTWEGRGNLFIALGALIGIGAIVLIKTVFGKRIQMNMQQFHYEAGSTKLTLPWASMRTFLPSQRKFLRSTMVGDHNRSVSFDSLCFADYDLIVSLIDKARKRQIAETNRQRGEGG